MLEAGNIYAETTHYMSVVSDDATIPSIEYVRTPFNEWCVNVDCGAISMLERVQPRIGRRLEEIFQEKLNNQTRHHG